MKNITKKFKIYLLVGLVLTCTPTPHVLGMKNVNNFFSKLAQKFKRKNNNDNHHEQQPHNIPVQEIGNNAQEKTIDSPIEYIKTLIDEKPPLIDVKITQTEQLKKDLEELEAAENFKLALKELKKQCEPEEKIQSNTVENNNEKNSPQKNIITIDEKNEKEELEISENNHNQPKENDALKLLIQELEKMKNIEHNPLSNEGNEFGKKLIETKKNLPLLFSEIVTFLITETKKRIKTLKVSRKDFIQKVLSEKGIKAQEMSYSTLKHFLRIIKIGGKWSLTLSVSGFIMWALLNSMNQIPYVEYLIPDVLFTVIGPFTVPKILWCIATAPIRLFGSWLDPQIRRNKQTLKILAEKCIESTKSIAQKIVDLNSNTGVQLLNKEYNPCAGNLESLKHLVSEEFKNAIGDNPSYFINYFSKILAQKNCIIPENLTQFAFKSTPATVHIDVLSDALKTFNATKSSGWSSYVSPIWNSITQGYFSDFTSW